MKHDNIKRIRESKKITQTKLAQVIGMDRSYINQIENGKKTPSIMMLERIAKVLDCSVKDFF